MSESQPIAAIATAPGRGGIGVLRVSGPSLQPLIQALCGRTLLPRQATYLAFLADDGTALDQGIAIYFPAPHSYTGEDVLELQGHGGPMLMQLLLRRVLHAGRDRDVRLAEPGEFTLRAFLNDKIDLAQAEAVADLIDASTEEAARSASRSLQGVFSDAVNELRDRLIRLRMLVEATLDFPEEEIDFLKAEQALEQLLELQRSLRDLWRRAEQGAVLRNGLNIVLVGEPNVGKSSLLNALAGADLAIVTPIAGTTRDKVSQVIQIEGVALNIIDTAGLRDSQDPVERIGIERTWGEIERADVVLHLVDVTAPKTTSGAGSSEHAGPPALELAADILRRLPKRARLLTVHNKIDLAQDLQPLEQSHDQQNVWVSAKTGAGLDRLRHELLALAGWQSTGESLFTARERHIQALAAVDQALERARGFANQGAAQLELLAEELRLAQNQLSAITGAFSADDLLGVIFGQFCIGK